MADQLSALKVVLTVRVPAAQAIEIDPNGKNVYYQMFLGFRLTPGNDEFDVLSVASLCLKISDNNDLQWQNMDTTSNFVVLGSKIVYHRTRASNRLSRYNGPHDVHFVANDFFSFDIVNIQVNGYHSISHYNNLTKYSDVLTRSVLYLENAMGNTYINNHQQFCATYDITMRDILAQANDLDNAYP